MKTLTLWQPYASLIADGLKQYETRSWSTKYRGVMLIHSSKKWDGTLKAERDHLARTHPALSHYWNLDLPLGCIVVAVELVKVHRVEDIRDELSELERAVGNYADKRFAWEMKVVKIPDEPIPAKGQQGLWEYIDGN